MTGREPVPPPVALPCVIADSELLFAVLNGVAPPLPDELVTLADQASGDELAGCLLAAGLSPAVTAASPP